MPITLTWPYLYDCVDFAGLLSKLAPSFAVAEADVHRDETQLSQQAQDGTTNLVYFPLHRTASRWSSTCERLPLSCVVCAVTMATSSATTTANRALSMAS